MNFMRFGFNRVERKKALMVLPHFSLNLLSNTQISCFQKIFSVMPFDLKSSGFFYSYQRLSFLITRFDEMISMRLGRFMAIATKLSLKILGENTDNAKINITHLGI